MNVLETGAVLEGRGVGSAGRWEGGASGGGGSLGQPSDSSQALQGQVEEAN